jgi:hypothetical protein
MAKCEELSKRMIPIYKLQKEMYPFTKYSSNGKYDYITCHKMK